MSEEEAERAALNARLGGRPPYTDEEWADLERQVREWIAEKGSRATIDDLRRAVADRRRIRFGILNALCILAYIDELEAK